MNIFKKFICKVFGITYSDLVDTDLEAHAYTQKYLRDKEKEYDKEEEDKRLKEESNNIQKIFNSVRESSGVIKENDISLIELQINSMIDPMKAAGQYVALAKLKWLRDSILPKEKQLISRDIIKYVNRHDIAQFIKNHKTRALKLASIVDYQRIIPKHALQKIEQTKDIFDQFVILYTDHSIKAASEVKKRKDPILFGIFTDRVYLGDDVDEVDKEKYNINSTQQVTVVSDRMYFLADWEDEFCDLTLDQLVNESKNSRIVKDLNDHTPANIRLDAIE